MTDLSLNRQISKIIESGSLTALVQTLAHCGQPSELPGFGVPCIGLVTLKDASLVFTDGGSYAELPAMLQTLEDIAVRHTQPTRK